MCTELLVLRLWESTIWRLWDYAGEHDPAALGLCGRDLIRKRKERVGMWGRGGGGAIYIYIYIYIYVDAHTDTYTAHVDVCSPRPSKSQPRQTISENKRPAG